MGALEAEDGQRCTLWTDHLVGRSPHAALRLDHPGVSWRHASLRWTGRLWELQDLGSLNGTFVDKCRVAAGTRIPLRLGTRLLFGEETRSWVVVNVDPPEPGLTALDDGSRVALREDLIVLPSADAPEVSLYRNADGKWIAEGPERTWEPQRDDVIEVGGRSFRFEPGSAVQATSAGAHDRPGPASIALEFAVSRNEEHVELSIVHDSHRIPLKPRAHTYLLLTLARARLRDQADASLPPTSHGWIEQSTLLRMLGTSQAQLALDIYRARRQFADAGIVNAAHIIERRTSSRELRIGADQLHIQVQ